MSVPTSEELIDLISSESLIERRNLRAEGTLESLGLDSVDTVSIVFAIEERFGIRLEANELSRQNTLGEFLSIVQAKAASHA